MTGVDVDVKRAADVERELDAGVKQVIDVLISGPAIDVLIHNAGINAVGRFYEVSIEEQERVVAVNLEAPMVLTAELLKAEHVCDGGSLVFTSSLSHYVSYPGASVYAATKSGLASYARSLSVALVAQDIHVMTVFPGPTRTAHARRYSPDNSREEKRMAPEALAERIFGGVKKRKRFLIPGFGNRMIAMIGKWFPGVSDGRYDAESDFGEAVRRVDWVPYYSVILLCHTFFPIKKGPSDSI